MSTSPSNPFRELRLRMGISQYELAKRAGISKHAILRLEQGCYDKPLPSALMFFENQFPGLSNFRLTEDYKHFQYETRLANGLFLGSSIAESLIPCPVGVHPLTFLRLSNRLNPTQLAKKLCISQSTIVYFEKSSVHQHTVPAQIIRALQDADYTEDDTDALVSAYKEYRAWLNSTKELTLVG